MKNKWIWILVLVVFVAGFIWLIKTPGKPGKLDEFASCLNDSGTTFFGAFWCPHCQAQKKLFGSSAKLIPYVECSTPDGQAQTQICIDKNITGYPTWIFADGTQLNGEIPLAQLAEKTACELPAE